MKNFLVHMNGQNTLIRAKSEKTLKKRIGKTALALGAQYKEIKQK